MEKDIGKISKNPDTEIVIRIDDFGGRRGLTIREFVSGERYTGFTKAGTRIPAEQFKAFKEMINSINEEDMAAAPDGVAEEGIIGSSGGEKLGNKIADSDKSVLGRSNGDSSDKIEEQTM